MKPVSFVPQVFAVSREEAGVVAGLGAAISHWTEGGHSAGEWLDEVENGWGTGAYALRRGEEVLGFVLYAPQSYLPRAARYPLGPFEESAVLLADVAGDARTRRRLLVRMLRELRNRGVGRVEAIASDRGVQHHVPTDFLVQSGWRVIRRAPYKRTPYSLMQTDLGSTVEARKLARALIGKVRLPGLRSPVPAPGTFAADGRAPCSSSRR